MSKIFEEAIADAKKLKEVAEENATSYFGVCYS